MDARDGVVTTDVLHRLGFGKRQVDGMVARGELIRMRRGMYRGRGVRWELRTQLQAALARQGDDARLVLISSLHWQGMLHRPAPLPEIGVPGNRGVERRSERVVHHTEYAKAGARVHDGLPCSAPGDALPHLAGHVRGDHSTRRALRRAVREAVRRDYGLLARLETAASRRVPGSQELRAALRLISAGTVVRSDLEEDFVAFCEIWGLPPFSMNRKVGGVERDAVRPNEQVIVELDTRGYHGNLISMESDRRRRRQATVAGWRHLEITGHDLRDEPGRVASDLAALLGLNDWMPPADAAKRWSAVIASARGIWLPRR